MIRFSILPLTGLLFFAVAGSNAASGADLLPGSLQQMAQQEVAARLSKRWPAAQIEVTVPPIEATNTQTCTQLGFNLRTRAYFGRIPLTITCRAPAPWQLFVVADARVKLPVLVASVPIARNQRLSDQDLKQEFRELRNLRRDYVSDRQQALGLQTKRPLMAGSVVYRSAVSSPMAIEKGQRLTIAAGRDGLTIQARGEALQAGRPGEQILVRNLQSGREVQAWVIAPGRVSSRWRDPSS